MFPYFLDFPLCSNSNVDEKIKEYILFCCDYLFERYPQKKLKAIVLTGSLSRGEGTILTCPNGSLRTFSDIEIMVVLACQSNLWQAKKTFRLLKKEASLELANKGLPCDVTYGAISTKCLQRLTPAMFTVELQKHGKVIWGDKDVLNEMPTLQEANIPRIDAINLLFNRMMGQLIALDNIEHADSKGLEDAIYHSAKVYLDIAGSLLTFQGKYEPTYLERARRFREEFSQIKQTWVGEKLKGFPQTLDFWTNFKLEPSLDKLPYRKEGVTTSLSVLREYGLHLWTELVDYVKAAWVWESNQFLGSTWTENPVILAREYCAKESLKIKIRGWLKLAKYSRLYKRRFSARRSLGLFPHASPQTLIRLSGAIIYFNMLTAIQERDNLEQASFEFVRKHRLPSCHKDDSAKLTWNLLKDEVIDNWQLFVKSI